MTLACTVLWPDSVVLRSECDAVASAANSNVVVNVKYKF